MKLRLVKLIYEKANKISKEELKRNFALVFQMIDNFFDKEIIPKMLDKGKMLTIIEQELKNG